MTIHVSLPKELENLVHQQVNTGMYGSASELVREALRRFFLGTDQFSPAEIAVLRETLKPRLEAARNGTAILKDGNSFFDEHINRLSE
jgi:antitoxin ParD1/3/4